MRNDLAHPAFSPGQEWDGCRAAIRDPSTGEVIRALDPVATHVAVSDETIRSIGLDWDFNGAGVRALAALGRVQELEDRLSELRAMPPSMTTRSRSGFRRSLDAGGGCCTSWVAGPTRRVC